MFPAAALSAIPSVTPHNRPDEEEDDFGFEEEDDGALVRPACRPAYHNRAVLVPPSFRRARALE